MNKQSCWHRSPLHLLVVLSRIALVDTILPYLWGPEKKKNTNTRSLSASWINGIHSMHASLPRCPQAAYRCTHKYLSSVSIKDQRAVCLPLPCLRETVKELLWVFGGRQPCKAESILLQAWFCTTLPFLLSSVLTELPWGPKLHKHNEKWPLM